MQNDLFLLSLAGIIASLLCTFFAVSALTLDNFRHGTAGGFALAAGFMPWICLGLALGWTPGFLMFNSLSALLFLLSFLVYHHSDGRLPGQSAAATASLLGMLAGLAVSFCSHRLLSLGE